MIFKMHQWALLWIILSQKHKGKMNSIEKLIYLKFLKFTYFRSEFYLISQSSNQGTVSPTHFHVIEGQNHLTPERLQILTYRFTHMYYNWPV
jgi:hypothetical protein